MKIVYFITIENNNVEGVTISRFGFTDLKTAQQTFNEFIEDYMPPLREIYGELFEERNAWSYYATNEDNLYFRIEIHSIEVIEEVTPTNN